MSETTTRERYFRCATCGERYDHQTDVFPERGGMWAALCSCDPETFVIVRADGSLSDPIFGQTKAHRAAIEAAALAMPFTPGGVS